jgi:hypothetical protein
MATMRRLRASLSAVFLGFVVADTGVLSVEAASADVDVFGFKWSVATAAPVAVLPSATTYSIDPGAACLTVTLPPPVGVSVPAYVDVPPDESGPCTAVTGTGNVTIAGCSTGLISANWQMTEPLGDVAVVNGNGVVVGGVVVVAAPLGGYSDGPPGTIPGEAVAVGLLTPRAGELCLNGTRLFDLAAVVAAAY